MTIIRYRSLAQDVPVQRHDTAKDLFLLTDEQQVALDVMLQRDGGQVSRIQPPGKSRLWPYGWVEVDGDRMYDWNDNTQAWTITVAKSWYSTSVVER